MADSIRWKAAAKASLLHFGGSLLVAGLAAALVFGIWFPYPYRELAGGRELFLLVVIVDVICGPLLTAVLFNPKKPKRELVLDLSLVALVQLAALGYGLYSVAAARPVYLVYEVDRFRVVSAADIDPKALKPGEGPLHTLPWTGPKIIGVREPRNPDEKLESLELSVQGLEPSARPDWWQEYELSKPQVLSRAKSIAELRKKEPKAKDILDRAITESGQPESQLAWVPLTSFKVSNWVAFVNKQSAEIRAFAPVDGF